MASNESMLGELAVYYFPYVFDRQGKGFSCIAGQ